MMILTVRTDKPEAELGLYDDNRQLEYETWTAYRALAETIHQKIKQLLESHALSLQDIRGVVVYKGPGSFTGLRIGLTVANALAFAGSVPIVGETGENWQFLGISRLKKGDDEKITMPAYGAEVNITRPKH